MFSEINSAEKSKLKKYIKLRKHAFLLLEFLSLYFILFMLLHIFPPVTTISFCCMLSHQPIPLLRKWICNKSTYSETQKILFLPNDLRFFFNTTTENHLCLDYLQWSHSCSYFWLLLFSLVTAWMLLCCFHLLENNTIPISDKGKMSHLQLITAEVCKHAVYQHVLKV